MSNTPGNSSDLYAVAVPKDTTIISHLPRQRVTYMTFMYVANYKVLDNKIVTLAAHAWCLGLITFQVFSEPIHDYTNTDQCTIHNNFIYCLNNDVDTIIM